MKHNELGLHGADTHSFIWAWSGLFLEKEGENERHEFRTFAAF